MKKENYLAIAIFIMIVVVAVWAASRPDLAPVFNLVLLAGLIAVTTIYAYSTMQIARASKEQAEEMKEQRVMASRPVIAQKAQQKKVIDGAIVTDYFSHFEIYNAGNGPAIEVEISLLNEEKKLIYSERESYLRAGETVKLLATEFGKEQPLPNIEPPIRLHPINLAVREKCTYLVSEYQSIYSLGEKPMWYQTWLPFEVRRASKEGEIYVIPGELEFREVTETGRINAFGSGSKPK